jgi:uncharacterized protein YdhG (YjbR/CyaY superfamily)
MTINASTPEEYIAKLPVERQTVIVDLRRTIKENLPEGFEEIINYGMISFVVPKTIYKAGYHCDPKLPLPFISIAAQKNFYAFYHLGIYADSNLLSWFAEEYVKETGKKPDMGKSCIRFFKVEQIPWKLMGELVRKISVDDWIKFYELNLKKHKTFK